MKRWRSVADGVRFRRSSLACVALIGAIALASAGRWVSAAALWREGSPSAGRLSLDEVVYIVLGDRLMHAGPYSAAGIEQLLGIDATELPSYLQDPLFKHPPLFPALVGLSRTTFSHQPWAAVLPSLLMGALCLGGLYWLAVESGMRPLSRWVAVFLLALSPIHWICSSRVWIEATLCTFVVLALAAHERARRGRGGWWLAGVFWGCAFLTKYTAIAAWLGALAATLALLRDAPVNRKVWGAHLLAVSLFAPWLLLRAQYEGWTVLTIWSSGIQEWRLLARMLLRPELVAIVAIVAGLLFWRRRAHVEEEPGRPTGLLLGATVALTILATGSFAGVTLFGRPWAGWHRNPLAEWGAGFYVTYRASLEPICLLGVVSCLALGRTKTTLVPQGAWVVLLVFLTAWGNYQSRYALPLIPVEALVVGSLAGQALRRPATRSDWAAAVLTVAWLALSTVRSMLVLRDLGLANDFFYF